MSVITRTAAIAALLLAAACSGQPEVLEPGRTSSPTSSTSATPPPQPKQAKESSDEGAAASAYHWIELFNYASTTGNVEPLRAYSQNCKACLDYASTIADLPLEDRPDDDPWTVTATTVSRDSKASDVRFSLKIPDGSTEDIAFELTPQAPYSISDMYSVEEQ